MKRFHRMPFGAEIVERGTRFRLWAPAAPRVELELEIDGKPTRRAMTACGGGWFECVGEGIGAGARYAFVVNGHTVPDPASRSNPDDVHRPSMVVDPGAYRWNDADWRGRRWEEAVIYELHVGAFTPAGTFVSALARLDELRELGVTAIELMPVADFPGRRNWGYDGVLPFAPDAGYGTPDDLKRLIDGAHERGLMVLLDVVYNHFGPEGNYLHLYAPQFFTERHSTPWGAAINFDGPDSRCVRDFYVHNALYWLEEFHLDGLRLDAVHAIVDDSPVHIVSEIAAAVRGQADARHVHIVLENDANEARYLARNAQGRALVADAQWNDDIHHAIHVLTTGETDGYYSDYAERPLESLGRCLAEGFAYQGDPSPFRGGAVRGEPSAQLPPGAFVVFTQTHDQVGNRANGERLSMLAPLAALQQAVAAVLLAPAVPMLFMGEEFAASSPFLFFCDFGAELAAAVTRGRREEFSRFERFHDAAGQASIPDPNAEATFRASCLDWEEVKRPSHRGWRDFYRSLLAVRAREIVPRLTGTETGGAYRVVDRVLFVDWTLGDGSRLHLMANFGPERALPLPDGRTVHLQRVEAASDGGRVRWEAHGLAVSVEDVA
jgi:maltooligosyltrehalose trehalohydrolase